MLDMHRCLPTTQLQQYHDGTMIVAVCKLIKSVLRIKRGTVIHYQEFGTPTFLTEYDWMIIGKFQSILRATLRLTLVCQNEEKLNGADAPVMNKYLHDV